MSTIVTPPKDHWTKLSRQFETSTPQQILQWACSHFKSKLTMATAFGAEGMVLVHMLSEIAPSIQIFNLETGYQFPETLALVDKIKQRYSFEVKLVSSEDSVERYEKIHGGPVYLSNPNQCCFDRKIKPLMKELKGKSAWITAIRRDQSAARADAPIVSQDGKFSLVKINPLANWNKHDIWAFIKEHDIPYNSLYDEGYSSIGCWPCTKKPLDKSDERSGRWQGFGKTECGLHPGK